MDLPRSCAPYDFIWSVIVDTDEKGCVVCVFVWQPLDQKQLHALLARFLKKDLVNAPLAIKTGAAHGGPPRTTSNGSDLSS